MKNNILLIEDDDEIRAINIFLLNLEGYNVIKSDSSSEAIEIVNKQLPDLIICEVMMQRADAYEIFTSLFKTLFTYNIPFIYILTNAKSKTANVLSIGNYYNKKCRWINLLCCVKECLQDTRGKSNLVLSLPFRGFGNIHLN